VPRAIGQSFDRFVAAEAEVRGARAADRPAALPLAELEQRAAAPIEDRDILGWRLWFRERRLKHLVLGGHAQARALRAPVSLRPRPRMPGSAPLLDLRGGYVARPRQAQAVQLADDGVAGHADLAGYLAA